MARWTLRICVCFFFLAPHDTLERYASAGDPPLNVYVQVERVAKQKGSQGGSWNRLVFSPDGQWAIGTTNGCKGYLWHLDGMGGMEQTAVLEAMVEIGEAARGLAWTPDGQRIYVGTTYGRVLVWQLDGMGAASFVGAMNVNTSDDSPQASVKGVALSPDGRWLLTAVSSDKGPEEVHQGLLWRLNGPTQWKKTTSLQGHTESISEVAFSPDGRWAFTGSWDNTGRLWQLDGQGKAEPTALLRGLSWWPMWNLEPRSPIEPDGPSATSVSELRAKHVILRATFSHDCKWLLTGSNDNTAKLWRLDAEGGAEEVATLDHNNTVTGVAFSPDSQWIFTVSSDKHIRIWRMAGNGRVKLTDVILLEDPGWMSISTLAVSPDGRWFLVGTSTDTDNVELWRFEVIKGDNQ